MSMITDAQVHLWPANGPQYPWPEGTAPDVPEALTAERFLPMMDAMGVARAVIAPPAVSGFDPSYALDCAARYPERFAVTSRWNFADATAMARLPTWLDKPGMIGIRVALLPSALEGLRSSGALGEFFRTAAQYSIPLMCFAPGTLGAIKAAAKAHPNLKMIVDHANLVGSTPDTLGAKIEELAALAHYDNVGVKLGALPQRSAHRYPYEDLHPHLNTLFQAFGPQRLMWASDLSTSLKTGAANYYQNFDMIMRSFPFASEDDMDWVLGRTVSTWFEWSDK